MPRIPEKKFKIEAEFQTWFGQKIHDEYGVSWPYHKMSDASADKKPCDCFFIDGQGRALFCELKVIDGYTLNIAKFEPQQVDFLTTMSSLGQVHSVALAPVYSKKLHRWIVLDWKILVPLLFVHKSVQIFPKPGEDEQEFAYLIAQ